MFKRLSEFNRISILNSFKRLFGAIVIDHSVVVAVNKYHPPSSIITFEKRKQNAEKNGVKKLGTYGQGSVLELVV